MPKSWKKHGPNGHRGPGRGGSTGSKPSRPYSSQSRTDSKVQSISNETNVSIEDQDEIDESRTPYKQLVGSLMATGSSSERQGTLRRNREKALEHVDEGSDEEQENDGETYEENEQEIDDEGSEDDGNGEEDDEDEKYNEDDEDGDIEDGGGEDADVSAAGGENGNATPNEDDEFASDDSEEINDSESDDEDDSKAAKVDESVLDESDPFLHRFDHSLKRQNISVTVASESSFDATFNTQELFDTSNVAPKSEMVISGSVVLPVFMQKALTKAATRYMKPRLLESWLRYRAADKDKRDAKFTAIQEHLLALITNVYSDVGFFARTLENAVDLREVQVLHALNHVFKARDRVEKHDALIQQRTREARSTGRPPEFSEREEQEFRDQGFTRARILVLLPYKSSAYKFIKLMLELFPPKTRVKNYDRFLQDFGAYQDDAGDEDDIEWRMHQLDKKYSANWKEPDFAYGTHPSLFVGQNDEEGDKPSKPSKANVKKRFTRPVDWHAAFDENPEEDFRVGIAINSRKSVKLFSSFYQSDIIVASPLGLRLATKQAVEADAQSDDSDADGEMGALDVPEESEDLKIEGDKKRHKNAKAKSREDEAKVETDFLSSIEVLIIDECDVFHTQNWQHVEDICLGINRRPKEMRPEMDFTRVYEAFLDGKPRKLRQTLIFSHFPDAQISALISRGGTKNEGLFQSPFGQVKVRVKSYPGIADSAPAKLVQRFKPIEGSSVDARYDYFVAKVLPKLCRADYGAGILLFVPSYFELIRVKKALEKEQKLASREERAMGEGDDDDADRAAADEDEDDEKKTKGKLGKNKKKKVKTFFECVTEYTNQANVSRARAKVFYGNTKILLMTERYYYYYRSRFRGIKRVVFYAPPQHAHFYLDLLEWIASPADAESVCFFTPFDALELERVVGTKRARKALSANGGDAASKAGFTIICSED